MTASLRVTVSRLLGCTITPALRRNRCAVTPRCGATAGAVTASLFGTEVVLYRPDSRAGPAGRWVTTQRPFLTATSILSPSRKTRFSSQSLDLGDKFPLMAEFDDDAALVGFEDGVRFALAT